MAAALGWGAGHGCSGTSAEVNTGPAAAFLELRQSRPQERGFSCCFYLWVWPVM